MTFLVDTNIIGELTRREPNAGVLAWAGTVSVVSLSVITVEEMLFGLAWKPNARIDAWIEGFLAARCRIHAVTDDIARAAGRLRGTLARRGLTRTQADMLIAATAQVHQETLVTRNVRDFEECGIGLLNPFS
jgi:predicted nucleic acid-binding protein